MAELQTCGCLEILCNFIQVPDLARIIQGYAHDPRILSDYGLSDFELYVRFSKYRGPGGLRISTGGAWMYSGPKYMPYAEISISPWGDCYHSDGREAKSATCLRIILIYVEDSNQKYVSAPMMIPLTKRKKFTDELFIPDGYDDFIESVIWCRNSGRPLTSYKIDFLSRQFREAYDAIAVTLVNIKRRIIHTGMPVLVCKSF